jgi:hypothetical protein
MAGPPKNPRTWTDEQLSAAVESATNWRAVMRQLGLCVTSAGSILAVKRQAAVLGLDTSHFRGKRSWSDAQLRRAVMESRSWQEALGALGLSPSHGDSRTRVKAHAIRLGLSLTHLEVPAAPEPSALKTDLARLRDAGPSLAAAWFALCGCNVALPIEPAVYDLLVSAPEGIKRIQVKTTTYFGKDGWMINVGRRPYSAGNREGAIPYDPEVIDEFFVVDGDLNLYLIPSRPIAGRVRILLRTYAKYIVGNASGLMTPQSRAA